MERILRLAVEQTAPEDHQNSVPVVERSQSDRDWLRSALEECTVDVAQELRKLLNVIKSHSAAFDDKITAIESLSELCEDIDAAKDFAKLDGVSILHSLFSSEQAVMREEACNLIAVVMQHNEFCQSIALEQQVLQTLLQLLDSDDCQSVRVKALFAVSCLCRDFEPGQQAFIKYDGLSVLIRAIQSDNDKLQTKATFLLYNLSLVNNFSDLLVELGYIDQLVHLLASPPNQRDEHLLMCLNVLLQSEFNKQRREESRGDLQLETCLQNKLSAVEALPEYQETRELCEALLKEFFTSSENSVSTDQASAER